jgi:hypothetical protein
MRTTRRWWPQWRPPWRAFPTSWTLGRPSCWPNCCVVLMMTKSIKTREVSVSIQTSRGGCHHRFSLSISPKEEESVLHKTKKRTIVIQRVTPSREDQIHVPFGGNLVYGNLLAS